MTEEKWLAQRHLELAFESSAAILKLAGFEENEETIELKRRILAGELSFDAAVQIVLERVRMAQSPSAE